MIEIFFNHFARMQEINSMNNAGDAAAEAELKSVPKNSLQMDGLDELLKRYTEVVNLVIAFGELVVKDAELLKNIDEAFYKTDQSVGGAAGSFASQMASIVGSVFGGAFVASGNGGSGGK